MANKGNIKLCKHCKSQIPSNVKVCPYCGKKQGGIVKKVAIGFVILMVIGAIGGNANDDEKPNLNPSNEIASKLEANEASKNNENSSQKVEDNQNDAQNSSQENEPQKEPTYNHYKVSELIDDLNANALKAKKTHKDEYVEIEGYLKTIDSDGKYFSLANSTELDEYWLDSIHCSIMSDEQIDKLMTIDSDAHILVKGKITDVGEVMGYYLQIDDFETSSQKVEGNKNNVSSSKKEDEPEYAINIKFGEIKFVVDNYDYNKCIDITTKEVNGSNTEEITYKHFSNVIDLIRNQGFDKYEKINYYSYNNFIDSYGNDVENKSIQFTIDKEEIKMIKGNEYIFPEDLENYITDYWLHPAIRNN